MPLAVTCPECRKNYVIREKHLGVQALCACGCAQVIPANAPVVPASNSWLDSPILLFGSIGLMLMSFLASGGVIVWANWEEPADLASVSTPVAAPEPKEAPKNTPEKKEVEKGPTLPATSAPPLPAPPRPALPPPPPPAAVQMNERQLYQRLLPSVVWILGSDGKSGWSGSGSVVHVGKRLILTNQHVVQNERQVKVLFPRRDAKGEVISDKKHYQQLHLTGKSQTAKVLLADKQRDLAVIQLEDPLPSETVALKVAPRPARAGEKLLSVGNPGPSSALWVVSPGVVRARVPQIRIKVPVKDRAGQVVEVREIVYRQAWSLETTLPINHGDSGSPVVNTSGQMTAVNFGGLDQSLVNGAPIQLMQWAVDRDEVLVVLRKVGIDDAEVLGFDSAPPASALVLSLIKQIEDADLQINRKGVAALTRVDPAEARRAVPALSRALQRRDDVDFRRRVVEELERIGDPARADLDCLVPLGKMRYKPAQLYAIEALRQLGTGSRSQIPLLVGALKDRDAEVRKKAATVLRDLGPSARPLAFKPLLAAAGDEDEEVSKTAFDALGELGKITPAEIDLLIEVVGDGKRPLFVRWFAALRLGELGSEAARAVPALTAVIQEEKDAELVKRSAEALGQIGEKRKETLAALLRIVLSEAVEPVRLASLDALARIDLSGFSTGRMLERTSLDAEPRTKIRNRIDELLKARIAALKNEELAELKPFLQHKAPATILFGLDVVAQRKKGAVLVPDVVKLMKHKDEKVSEKALKVLEILGPEAKSGLPDLAAALKGLAGEPRMKLALLMISIDPKDDVVHDAVLPVFIDDLHPDRLGKGKEDLRLPIYKAMEVIGQPAVDAIFKRFDTISYRSREAATHRLNLYVALLSLARQCKSKENYTRLKRIRAKEAKEYQDVRAAAGKALAAMDPG